MAFCIFCSLRTVPKRHRKKYETVLSDESLFICEGPFLQCSECGAGTGRKCLKEVLGLMDETVRFSDEWSSVVHNFVNSEGTPPTSFVGHCCEHRWLPEEESIAINKTTIRSGQDTNQKTTQNAFTTTSATTTERVTTTIGVWE